MKRDLSSVDREAEGMIRRHDDDVIGAQGQLEKEGVTRRETCKERERERRSRGGYQIHPEEILH